MLPVKVFQVKMGGTRSSEKKPTWELGVLWVKKQVGKKSS